MTDLGTVGERPSGTTPAEESLWLLRRARRGVWLSVLFGAGAGGAALFYLYADAGQDVLLRAVWRANRGLIVYLSVTGAMLFGALALWASGVVRGIERVHRGILEMAVTDSLTHTYNRYRLLEELQRAHDERARYGMPYGVLLLDLDLFKKVNDRYGHAIGDKVLVGVIDRVRPILRRTDGLFRYGGEEFVVLASNTTLHDASALADRIRDAIHATPIRANGVTVPMTISIGVAATPLSENPEAWEVLDRADAAMYRAKAQGRNRVVVEEAETVA